MIAYSVLLAPVILITELAKPITQTPLAISLSCVDVNRSWFPETLEGRFAVAYVFWQLRTSSPDLQLHGPQPFRGSPKQSLIRQSSSWKQITDMFKGMIEFESACMELELCDLTPATKAGLFKRLRTDWETLWPGIIVWPGTIVESKVSWDWVFEWLCRSVEFKRAQDLNRSVGWRML